MHSHYEPCSAFQSTHAFVGTEEPLVIVLAWKLLDAEKILGESSVEEAATYFNYSGFVSFWLVLEKWRFILGSTWEACLVEKQKGEEKATPIESTI